jgi:hypothetical protein
MRAIPQTYEVLPSPPPPKSSEGQPMVACWSANQDVFGRLRGGQPSDMPVIPNDLASSSDSRRYPYGLREASVFLAPPRATQVHEGSGSLPSGNSVPEHVEASSTDSPAFNLATSCSPPSSKGDALPSSLADLNDSALLAEASLGRLSRGLPSPIHDTDNHVPETAILVGNENDCYFATGEITRPRSCLSRLG